MTKDVKFENTYFIKKAHFENKFKTGNFNLKPDLAKQISKISDDVYDVSIRIKICDTVENPFPFNLEIVGTLRTHFTKGVLEGKDLDEYLNITCVSALYPYVRAAVSNLCTSSMVNPVILPILNVKKLKEEKESF